MNERNEEMFGKVQLRVKQRIREAKGKSQCVRRDIDEVVVRLKTLLIYCAYALGFLTG